MATIKNYTDIKQSKVLAEILPIESADGFWEYHNNMWYSEGDEWEGYEDYPRAEPYLEYTRKDNEWKEDKSDVPCWSLAALLDVLKERDNCNALEMFTNKAQLYTITTSYYKDASWKNTSITSDNPVDACVAMIEKLHELNLL